MTILQLLKIIQVADYKVKILRLPADHEKRINIGFPERHYPLLIFEAFLAFFASAHDLPPGFILALAFPKMNLIFYQEYAKIKNT